MLETPRLRDICAEPGTADESTRLNQLLHNPRAISSLPQDANAALHFAAPAPSPAAAIVSSSKSMPSDTKLS